MIRCKSVIGTVCAVALLAGALTGCPTGPVFEIWIFNASNAGEMVLITIENERTGQESNVVISVPPNSAQIIPDIAARPFIGDEIRVGVRGDFGGIEGDRTYVIAIEEELRANATLPIVMFGNNPISLIGKYLPLSEASKGLLQLRNDFAFIAPPE
jgi:hypothetical protein